MIIIISQELYLLIIKIIYFLQFILHLINLQENHCQYHASSPEFSDRFAISSHHRLELKLNLTCLHP